ncbi:MAG: peptidase MA family metallohydrolase [Bacteroidales bacterium]
MNAQYFGQNKPSYRVFDYKVYQSPNFEIYHYLSNDSVLNMLAGRSEAWYRHHQAMFLDTLKERNPLFIYENHAEFQQTLTVSSMLGESTGGVTEALKRRVAMPLTNSFPQTDYVLGHELVHVFQYHMLTTGDSLRLSNVSNIPLWMVEGMAEYLSRGSVDPHTAMWMRDAVLSNDIPTIKDLSKSNKYFPYRYGQSLMAFIGKTWGDSSIVKLFRETALNGYEKAFENVFGHDDRTISGLWKLALQNACKQVITDTTDKITGRKVLFSKNAGSMNLSPSISPDGKYIVFLSERDVYDLDLFLADAEKGKIIRKLSNRINRNEIDAFNYLESPGTWSPDNNEFAFVVFSEGKNKLIIFNIKKMKIVRKVELPGLPSITNPSWSPDGRYIAVTGMKSGVSDIYLYNVKTEAVKQVTNNIYGNLQPSWSPDGKYIAYVTDKPQPSQKTRFIQTFYNIGIVNTEKPEDDRLLKLFTGAANMNPLFSPDGKELYFLSDRDGFRNLYKYNFKKDTIYQMTKYMRGISGITFNAPAISVSTKTGEIVYSYYSERSYSVYFARPEEFLSVPVEKNDIDFTAGTLPPLVHVAQNIVDSSLFSEYDYFADIQSESYYPAPYRPRFKLDYITNGSIGVTTGGPIGTGMEGSISAIFGDMSGDNQVFTSLSLNGEIYDFGGVVAYLNQKHKLKWGLSLSHIPNYYGYLSTGIDTLVKKGESYLVNAINLNYLRMFEDNVTLFAYYPFSQTRRFEASGMLSTYYYRFDQYKTYYNNFGIPIGTGREKIDAPDGFGLQYLSAAYVVDNSIMGVTGPVRGTRYRFEGGKYFGRVDFFTTLADYRKYFYLRPFTLALRSYNIGRWGNDAESDIVTPLYIGYPWLIRGYQRRDNYWSDAQLTGEGISLDNLFGSRIFIGNVEFRIPVTGPEKASLIKSNIFFTSLNLFTDGGLAMNKGSKIGTDFSNPSPNERVPVFSYGLSFRINLFGYLVIEPFYAVPIRSGTGFSDGSFGINFTPGW